MVEQWSSKSHAWVRFLLLLLSFINIKKIYKLQIKKITFHNWYNTKREKFFNKKNEITFFHKTFFYTPILSKIISSTNIAITKNFVVSTTANSTISIFLLVIWVKYILYVSIFQFIA